MIITDKFYKDIKPSYENFYRTEFYISIEVINKYDHLWFDYNLFRTSDHNHNDLETVVYMPAIHKWQFLKQSQYKIKKTLTEWCLIGLKNNRFLKGEDRLKAIDILEHYLKLLKKEKI